MNHNSDNFSRENLRHHTLDLMAEQRTMYVRGLLRDLGQNLRVSDEEVQRYLMPTDPELLGVSVLGSPEDLMPQEVNPAVHHQLLYMVEDESWKNRELALMTDDSLEANTLSTIRSIYLIFRLGAIRDETVQKGYCFRSMTKLLTDRAVYLAGKYDIDLPSGWVKGATREEIESLLVYGIQNREKHYRLSESDYKLCSEKGISREEAQEHEDHINHVFRRERRYALNDFFEKKPDPRLLANQLLDGSTLETFAKIQQGDTLPS